MTPDQEQHLSRLLNGIKTLVEGKYRKGAESHKDSDPLLSKTPLQLLDDSILEKVDDLVYSLSLRERYVTDKVLWEYERYLQLPEILHNEPFHSVARYYTCETVLEGYLYKKGPFTI